MAYVYEYINTQNVENFVKFTLKLTDSEGIFPEKYIPVIVSASDNNDENLTKIATNAINQSVIEYQILNTVTENIVLLEEPINHLTENIIDSLVDGPINLSN